MNAGYEAKTIFAKTDKGREEISQRTHGLNPQQRRVLIVIDGVKSFDEIIEIIPAVIPRQEMNEIFSYLLAQRFIATKGMTKTTARVIELHANSAEPEFTEDPATIRLVKDFMTTTCQTYLGLLGADVIQRIERAKSAQQLMSVVGYWHMALRDSTQGNRFAGPYLEQVKMALAYGADTSGMEKLKFNQNY